MCLDLSTAAKKIVFFPFLGATAINSNTTANLDRDVDAVARMKCQSTQQVMRFDIWHQGVIKPAPAAERRLLVLGGRAVLSEGTGRLTLTLLFVGTSAGKADWKMGE